MALLGKGALLNWGGVLPKHDLDYNLWHSLEHMPERMSVKGFFRAFRCVGLKGTNDNDKYFMMYEAEKKEVFVSKEYLERLNNPTSWTKEILSNYISPSRTICSVIASKSIGLASFISTIRFVNKEVENEHNVEQLKLSINDITSLQGVTGMHVLLGDNTFGQMNTEEKKFRSSQGKNDVIISQGLILEGLNFCDFIYISAFWANL